MKRLYRLLLCTFMCISIVFTCSAAISAVASVGKVGKVSVSRVASDEITLKWKKVSGATGYYVYRYSSKNDKYVSVGKTKKVTYTDDSLSGGKAYKYKVRAYKVKNKKNVYGDYSEPVTGVTAPKKVTGIKVDYRGTNSVRLTWKKISGATGYEVFMYDKKKKTYVSKGTVSNNYCMLKKLSQNTEYKIKIAAFHNKDGKVYGSKSSAFTFRTAIPSVSTLGVHDITKTSFTLKWSAVKTADGYRVYRYDSSKKKWKKVRTTTSTSYKVKDLKSGTSYIYKVRAYKKNGSSYNYGGYSAKVTAYTIPGTPKKLTAKTDNKTVTLSWKANGKSTGYEICRYNAANGTWEDIGTTKKTTYKDETLAYTSEYNYKVRAYVKGADKTYTTAYTSPVSVFFEGSKKPESVYSGELAENGIFGYLYDPAEKCFYTANDPWQRIAGYNGLYDVISPLTAIDYDTVRIKFEYGRKDWLLQLWKGQYGFVFYGAEMGIYNKPKIRGIEHYDGATGDDMLMMSMDFYRNDTKKFSRPYGTYWWCTGFVPGNVLGAYHTLRLDARVTMKDYTMLSAVKKALESESVIKSGATYKTKGLDVYITF